MERSRSGDYVMSMGIMKAIRTTGLDYAVLPRPWNETLSPTIFDMWDMSVRTWGSPKDRINWSARPQCLSAADRMCIRQLCQCYSVSLRFLQGALCANQQHRATPHLYSRDPEITAITSLRLNMISVQ